MPDLSTNYLGLKLKNPIIMGSSKLTADVGKMQEAERAGVAAVVCASLFEEQIQLEEYKLDRELENLQNRDPEIQSIFPDNVSHSGPQEHLMWVKKTKENLDIPVIASLNATTKETWVEWAQELANTGVDGLELNFYYTPKDMSKPGAEVEAEQVDILKAVKAAVDIPISAKLSFFYSNPLNIVKQMDDVGVSGFVLFNRLFESDIDIDEEAHTKPFNLSQEGDNKLPTRFMGLLSGQVKASLCSNTGVLTGRDIIKTVLSGADAVQIVTALYVNRFGAVSTMLDDVNRWMEFKGYESIDDFKGKLSAQQINDKFVYRRAQYVDLVLNSDKLMSI